MPTLYIIQGFLGAGKTTYSKKLAEEVQAIRLNGDEWCENHFSSQQLDENWNLCFSKAIETLWEEAENNLRNGKSVILDFGFWTKESRDFAISKAMELKVQTEHHYIYAPDNILLERLRHRKGSVAEKNLNSFSELKKYFEIPSNEEQVTLIENF
jgi:predicted kinase